jgi:PAS domain S-box-containing protein
MTTTPVIPVSTGESAFLRQDLEENLQVQRALNSILRIALEPISLQEQFRRVLESIVVLRWLAFDARGCIYLAEDEPPRLVMKSQVGLPDAVLTACAEVPFGSCLCGRAIAVGDLVFASCLDERHEREYAGMQDHGHFCVPIVFEGRATGLLNLNVQAGHEPTPLEEGFLRAVADVLAGMIERHRVQESLGRAEERFELALRGTDIGVWEWDLSTNQLYYSPHWKQLLGYAEDEIGNHYDDWFNLLHPGDRERAVATIRDFLEARRPDFELDQRLRRKDGSYRWILVRGVLVRDENGQPCRIAGTQMDITERKKVQQQLKEREAGLEAARRILDELIPHEPFDSQGLRIEGACFAADYAPGDFFDYFAREDGSVVVVVADASGHGIESALLMSSTQARLRSYAELSLSIEEMLERTNSVLFRTTRGEHFVTMMLLSIDPASQTFRYASAGHPSGYLFAADGRLKRALDSLSMPLAFEHEGQFPVSTPINYEPGDLILLLTDGVLEARSRSGEQFGVHRVLEALREEARAPTEAILARLHRSIHEFTGKDAPEDDETIVLVRVHRSNLCGTKSDTL